MIEFYMRILRLSDTDSIVVLEDGAVGRFVVGFLELELDDALVDVLSGGRGTFLMIRTLNSTS
jgi:hypothetical protein